MQFFVPYLTSFAFQLQVIAGGFVSDIEKREKRDAGAAVENDSCQETSEENEEQNTAR